MGEEALRNLDEQGIVRIGAEVGPKDVLVGKVTPKSEKEQADTQAAILNRIVEVVHITGVAIFMPRAIHEEVLELVGDFLVRKASVVKIENV